MNYKNGQIISDRINLLLMLLIALVAADGVISHFLVIEHLAIEANPFMRRWVGDDIFLVIKLGGGFFAAVLLWFIHRRLPKVSEVAIIISVVLYTAIIYWNLMTLLVASYFK